MAEKIDPKNANAPGDAADRDSRDTTSEPSRRTITGPGAADFLTATGGLDGLDDDPATGVRAAEDSRVTEARRLTPDLDEPNPTTEREIVSPEPPARDKR